MKPAERIAQLEKENANLKALVETLAWQNEALQRVRIVEVEDDEPPTLSLKERRDFEPVRGELADRPALAAKLLKENTPGMESVGSVLARANRLWKQRREAA